jgi:hypothetical protein
MGRSAFDRPVGISKEQFEQAAPDLVKLAFEHPSGNPTNPRMLLMNELVDLLGAALSRAR